MIELNTAVWVIALQCAFVRFLVREGEHHICAKLLITTAYSITMQLMASTVLSLSSHCSHHTMSLMAADQMDGPEQPSFSAGKIQVLTQGCSGSPTHCFSMLYLPQFCANGDGHNLISAYPFYCNGGRMWCCGCWSIVGLALSCQAILYCCDGGPVVW